MYGTYCGWDVAESHVLVHLTAVPGALREQNDNVVGGGILEIARVGGEGGGGVFNVVVG